MAWTPERWKRAEAHVDALLDLDPDARRAYLDAHCSDADIRADVEALLAADARDAGDLFVQGIRAFAAPLVPTDEPDAKLPILDLGPYRLMRQVGRGGMGTVYLAERSDGLFERNVAVKVAHVGLSEDALRRFEDERRLLATLDHVGIARLLDGGQTDDGRPFFVMEYVDGAPITEYAERNGLDLEARLRLFADVCDAVRYAHRHLVVHRDLKPSNLLVARGEGGQPVAKLLDFGIAKLLRDDGGLLTTTRDRWLTPEYASPEQVRGDAITTASDVYQLGVLLYELLTGRRPFRMDERLRHEIARAILETEPERPSTVVTRSVSSAQDVDVPTDADSAGRSRLSRKLRGDLDAVALMALRKEPSRRYDSVDALSADVGRHLDGLPVSARPDTLGYRARRFVWRRRGAVALAVAALIALTSFGAVYVGQAEQTRRERDRAEASLAFMSELFSASSPGSSVDADDQVNRLDVTLREALALAADRVRRELGDRPQIKMTVSGIVARNLWALGDSSARDAVTFWADLADQHADSGSKERRDALTHRAHTMRYDGRLAEAESVMVRVVYLAERADAPAAERAEAYNDLAGVRMDALDTPGRIAAYRRALPLYREAARTDTTQWLNVATASLNLADALQGADESPDLVADALAIYRERLPPTHPDIGTALYQRSVVEYAQGDTALAIASHRSAVEQMASAYGRDHQTTLFYEGLLAGLLVEARRTTDALALYRSVAERQRKAEVDPAVLAATLQNMTFALPDTPEGDSERRALYAEAHVLFRTQYGSSHPHVAYPLISLAGLLVADGQLAEAVAVADSGLAVLLRALPPDAAPTLFLANRRALALTDLGRTDEARSALAAVCDAHDRAGDEAQRDDCRARVLQIPPAD